MTKIALEGKIIVLKSFVISKILYLPLFQGSNELFKIDS